MNNIGGQNGATPPQIIKQIVGEITDRALAQVKRKGIEIGTEQAKDVVKSQLEREVKDKLKKLLR
ncbi:hypothetical protein JW960_10190 [candidate division KSB1 bacterium]|nr:hypothetical protein [candidate division KSB1 bacterium]